MKRPIAWTTCAVAALVASTPPAASAEELTVAVSSEASAIDPHYHNLGPNNQVRRHIFESLVDTDASQRLEPGLAESWEATDDTTWKFNLRRDVKFHDGSDFDAQDVIWTLCRIPNVPDAVSPFTIYTKAVETAETPDPYTLIITTATPYPLVPTEFSTWGIVPAPDDAADLTFDKEGCAYAGEWPKTEDYNNGKLAIGTGPYKFEDYVKGDRLTLTRFDEYWGDKPAWETVVIRPITSDGPRVAALLAGDVDMIETPPVQDIPRLEQDPGFKVVSGLSNRVIYLHLDQHGEDTPGITGVDGNPLLDKKVRHAISAAIDRQAIVDRLMGGAAVPAAQLLPESMFGSDPDMKVQPYDPDLAKKLLEEAGYADGFGLTIGTPNDRYINDEKVAQAVAQMLTRIGIQTQIDASTASVFFKRRNNYEFSVYLAGWGAATGEMSSPLKALVATQDEAKGYGGTNRGRYSNPELDALLDQALETIDDAEREALLRKASRLVIEDYGIIPLHYEVTPWGLREGLDYEPRADQYTLAFRVTPSS
ncbi:MAG: ABC transporter substrate-binding protein [Geminicoccaceae bacterium]|nr:ABC transporter substrate-binding protein [Geminicoccaceae bacterium]